MIRVELNAMEPTALLEHPTPPNVWMRLITNEDKHAGWPEIELIGDRAAVKQFIIDHWGDDDPVEETYTFETFTQEEAT